MQRKLGWGLVSLSVLVIGLSVGAALLVASLASRALAISGPPVAPIAAPGVSQHPIAAPGASQHPVAALRPRRGSALIRGASILCGGPYPGRCRPGTVAYCPATTAHCRPDFVRVSARGGRFTARLRLRDGRFRVRVAPGWYTVRLMAVGPSGPYPVKRRRILARAGATATVRFVSYVP